MAEAIPLRVNGRWHELDVAPETPLLYVLRNDLGLKAAKFGCGLEQCGACKVIVDGEAVHSCRLPLRSIAGSEVVTLEGLGGAGGLDPLQEAFLGEQAAQCGYCLPGILMAAKALLEREAEPSDERIREELAPHLCRCGSHPRILRAIRRAARTGRP